MAKEILEGVQSAGVDVKLRNLRKNDWSKIIKELMDASVVAIGSPTLNNGMFFTVAGFLSYMKGLRPKGKKFFVFGSYGWGGGAVKGVEKELAESGFEIVEPGFQVNFKPFEEDRAKCREIGSRLASLAKE
jgi:flavorubredoxin